MSYKKKIYLENHNNFFDKIIKNKRLEISNIINQLIEEYKLTDVTDIGTTNDDEFESSNLIIKNLKKIKEYKSISDQLITSKYFIKTLNKSITSNFAENEFSEFSSDLIISNATIEHVGSLDNQIKMIQNIIKLTKKVFVISTPNKFYPLEFHTKIPILHWLPNHYFRKIIKIFGYKDLSEERNLNLLSKSQFVKILNKLNFKDYKFEYINLFFFKSNIILIGLK